jgi:hypothetical protein
MSGIRRSATWAQKELRAIDELFDDGRCTPELLDALKERVWRELEEANECGSKTISVSARNLASVK